MDTWTDEIAARLGFAAIGEQNPKIKQLKGIISNTKPNPHKLFAAEGIWILQLCERFHTPIDSVFFCPEHIRTPEARALAEKIDPAIQFQIEMNGKMPHVNTLIMGNFMKRRN